MCRSTMETALCSQCFPVRAPGRAGTVELSTVQIDQLSSQPSNGLMREQGLKTCPAVVMRPLVPRDWKVITTVPLGAEQGVYYANIFLK